MHLRYDRARIIFPANAPPVPSTGQFDSFFQAWHSLQPHAADPAAAMAAFFDAWQRIPAGPAPTPPTLDACQFTEFAAAFPAAHARHMRSGVRANAWRSTGVGHDELRNTAVLRWLLDRLGDHGQGPDLLVALSPEDEWTANPFHLRARGLNKRMKDGLLVPAEEESLTVRATRDALAKLDADPTRLLN